MRIGVCFSGQLRTGVWAIPAIKSFIGDLWEDCDFFLHTWDSYYEKNYSTNVIQNLSELMSININYTNPNRDIWRPLHTGDLNRFLTIYNPKLFLIENHKATSKSLEQHRSNYVRQQNLPNNPEFFPSALYYSYYRSISLLQQYEQRHGVNYDIIIKLRPDAIFPIDDGSPIYRYKRAELRKDIENVLSNPNKLYRKEDVYWISTGENIKKANLFWEKSLNAIDVSFWSYAASIGIDVQMSTIGYFTLLRNLWKHVPVNDWFMLDSFEKFFLDLPPQIQNVSDPNPDFNEQHFNKLKSYIHNYSIIKELCDETNCTTTNLKKGINEKN